MTSIDAPASRPRVIWPLWAWKSAISASFQAASSGVLAISFAPRLEDGRCFRAALSIRFPLRTIRPNRGGDVEVGVGAGRRDDQLAGHGRERRSPGGTAEQVDGQVEVLAEIAHREQRRVVPILQVAAAADFEQRCEPLENPEDVVGGKTG